MGMDEEGRRRAGGHAATVMARQGWDPSKLAAVTGLDIGTVRDFLDGTRWPRAATRNAIEAALKIDRGEFELVARGIYTESDVDPVERAIDASPLGRAARAELKAHYFTLLDQDERTRLTS